MSVIWEAMADPFGCRSCPGAEISTPALGALSRRLLRRLGILVDAPLRQYRSAYETLLPGALNRGFYALLAEGTRQARGSAESWNEDVELAWLADQLRLRRPSADPLPWFQTAWRTAEHQAHVPPVRELSVQAKLAMLGRLRDEPEYPGQLEDALADAMRIDARPHGPAAEDHGFGR